MTYRTDTVEGTRDLAAALAALARPGDLILLAGEMGVGKTAFAQGFARGLGIDEAVTSPTFTLVRHYEGRIPLHHVDVYRLERLSEIVDLGLPELLDGPGVCVIEWGDVVAGSLPGDFLEVRLAFGEQDDERFVTLRVVGPSWAARQRVLAEALGGVVVLVIGIESSTQQVGVAIGGHEGVLALFETSRGRRHVETLAPAIAFTCAQARIELSEIGVVAVDVGPGLFTGLRVGVATAKALAHALRVPMIGISSLDLLAFSVRFTPRVIVAAIDARRGELFYAFYRQVPGGVQRMSEPAAGSPDDLASELVASGREHLLVGDGALRYKAQLEELQGVELVEQWMSYPSAAPLVQLAHARALREDWVNSWELEPLYLRKPDAEINWTTRHGEGAA